MSGRKTQSGGDDGGGGAAPSGPPRLALVGLTRRRVGQAVKDSLWSGLGGEDRLGVAPLDAAALEKLFENAPAKARRPRPTI